MAKENKNVEAIADISMEDVTEVKRAGDVIIFKVNKPVPMKRFQLIDAMVRDQMEKSGLKIVLMPSTCDLEEK